MKCVASGPGAVQFADAGYGRFTATLVTAGSYVLTATFGGKLASGAIFCVPPRGMICLAGGSVVQAQDGLLHALAKTPSAGVPVKTRCLMKRPRGACGDRARRSSCSLARRLLRSN